MKSLREQIAGLQDPAPKDFDPESIEDYAEDLSDVDAGHSPNGATVEFDGREHYEDVAPSKLKKPVQAVLGRKYAGNQVRREDLGNRDSGGDLVGEKEEDSDTETDSFAPICDDGDEDGVEKNTAVESEGYGSDNPSSEGRAKMRIVTGQLPEDEEDELDSDEAFEEDNAGRVQTFKSPGGQGKRHNSRLGSDDEEPLHRGPNFGQRADGLRTNNGAGISDSSGDSEEDSHEKPSDGSESDVEMSNGSPTSDTGKKVAEKSGVKGDRAALKALLSSDTTAVASSISAAAAADAKKGRAVKAQYQTLDRLIDVRIKLQKGLTASNSIVSGQGFNEHKDAVEAAEKAALTLWDTIASIRHSFAEAQFQTAPTNEKKRKRPAPATTSTPLTTLWSDMESLSSATLPHHRTILNKWSAKVRASNPAAATESASRLLSTTHDNHSITNVIDAYLATSASKLVAHSTTTTAPEPGTSQLTGYYDDTPFYQSLLRDLISSRRQSESNHAHAPGPSSSSTIILPSTLHTPGSRTKRIDTKASKGRKVRYTVHERLQNFMAAETDIGAGGGGGGGGGGIGRWTEEARREFFASLMGGRAVLDEERGGVEEVGVDGQGQGQEEREALRLFQSQDLST